MPLQALPLEAADAAAFVAINGDAFTTDFDRLLFPQGRSKDAADWMTKEAIHLIERPMTNARYVKIVDQSSPQDDYNQIISVAKWIFNCLERTEAQLDIDAKYDDGLGPCPGMGMRFSETFFGETARKRRELFQGNPYILLQILATRPEHERKGAGGLLVRWGVDQAERLGLPIWVEASSIGVPVYERHGFVAQGQVPFDAKSFGLSDDLGIVYMLRPAPERPGKAQ